MSVPRNHLDRLAGGLPTTFWWLWGGALVSALATFVLPFLALYLTARGLSVAEVGRITALYGVGTIAAAPLAGVLADRVGRRPTLLGGLLCAAAATLVLAAVAAPAALGAAVLLVGLSSSTYRPAAMAVIADVVAPESRIRAYGLLRWGNNVGFAISSVVGGLLAQAGFGRLFLADAITTLLFAGLVAARVPETRPAGARGPGGDSGSPSAMGALLRDRVLLALLGLQLLFALPLWQFQLTLPVAMLAEGHGPAVFGRVLAVNGLLIALLQPSVAAWAARHPPARMMALGAGLLGVGFGAYALCHGALAFAAATAVWSVGEIVFMPVASSTVAALAPVALRGRYQGASTLSFGLGMTLGPVLGAATMAAFGARALWAGCLCTGALAAAGLLALSRALQARVRAPTAARIMRPV